MKKVYSQRTQAYLKEEQAYTRLLIVTSLVVLIVAFGLGVWSLGL